MAEIDEARFRRLEEDVRRLEDRFDKSSAKSSLTHEEIFRRLNALEQSNAVANERFDTIIDQLSELKTQQATIIARLDNLAQKPAKRWDIAVTAVITAIGSGLVGFIGYLFSKSFNGGM